MNQEENNIKPDKHEIDERLDSLLKMGWIMLPDSCPSPGTNIIIIPFFLILACNCPLMMSQDNQKYCVGCEQWHFEKKRQKYGELMLKGVTDVLKKEMSVQSKTSPNFDLLLNDSVIRCLQTKLYFLSSLLGNESDISKIKELLETIKYCLEDIRLACCLDKVCSFNPKPGS